MKILIQHKIQAGFGVALAFLLFTGATAWWSASRNAAAFRSVERAYQVLDEFEQILVDMLDTQTGERGFVITGDEKFLAPYRAGVARVQQALENAKRLTQDQPNMPRRLAVLEPLIKRKINFVDQAIALRRSGDAAGALQLIATGEGKQTMDDIRKLIAEMERGEESRLLK